MIQTLVLDLLSTPVQDLARNDGSRIVTEETLALRQDSSQYGVATVSGVQCIDDYRGLGVGITVERIGVTERNSLCAALDRVNGQDQFVDTVVTRTCLIINVIAVRCTDSLMAEVIHSMPSELVSFTDGEGLNEMVIGFIFGQYQPP